VTMPGLSVMVRGGLRAVSQYTGMLLALLVVHVLVAWGAGVLIMNILASAFADKPIFDEAVDGDLVALAEVVRNSAAVIDAVGWVAAGAVVSWMIVSWFLAAGILGVFTDRPRGRADTARCFGASGASYFLVFARLGLVSLLYHVPVYIVLQVGLAYAADKIQYALTMGEVVRALLIGLLPAALLHVLVSTIIDYARAELVLRRPTHESLGAVRAAIRATGYVFRRPVAIGHVLLYWLVFIFISVGFAWVAHDHAMLGTSGALALFALRQGVVLLRLAARVAVIAGQVELTATRPPPPREVKPGE
jgi:hypothetical protein